MKKLFIGIAMIFSTQASAQDFVHGIGIGGIYGIFTEPNVTAGATTAGVMYKASLGFEVGKSNLFAVSAYPFLGITGVLSSRGGGSGSFGYELPINGEYYFGDMDDRNFFVGAGLNLMGVRDSEGYGGSIIGPQIAFGGQFEFKDQLLGLRFGYTLGMNRPKYLLPTDKFSKHGLSLSLYRLF